MLEELKSISTSLIDIKKFSYLFSAIFILLGILFFYFEISNYSITFTIIGFLFLLTGLIMPAFLKPIYLVWMSFAVILGWVMSRLILIILFILVLLPTAIFAKLLRKKFLSTIDNNTETYWEKIQVQKKPVDYEKQF